MTPLLLIGGGGHRRACVDVVESTDTHHIVGVVERVGGPKEAIFGYPVIGYDDALAELIHEYRAALITIGQIKSPGLRMQLFDKVRDLGALCQWLPLEVQLFPGTRQSARGPLS